jgi:hypothetical protein
VKKGFEIFQYPISQLSNYPIPSSRVAVQRKIKRGLQFDYCSPSIHYLEAATGFEPVNNGFAELQMHGNYMILLDYANF